VIVIARSLVSASTLRRRIEEVRRLEALVEGGEDLLRHRERDRRVLLPHHRVDEAGLEDAGKVGRDRGVAVLLRLSGVADRGQGHGAEPLPEDLELDVVSEVGERRRSEVGVELGQRTSPQWRRVGTPSSGKSRHSA
jgi:hypothetical protein